MFFIFFEIPEKNFFSNPNFSPVGFINLIPPPKQMGFFFGIQEGTPFSPPKGVKLKNYKIFGGNR